MLMPSMSAGALDFSPIKSSSVGIQSSKPVTKPEVLPALILPGQRTMSGTRTPPSYSDPLRPRNGLTLSKKS